jgi:hypothetical protein
LAFPDEAKFRVTVSLIRRGRRGHAKEHVMLDSKMVPRYGSRWLSFDVLSAVTAWQDKPASNLGLVIEVEDEEMNRRNAFHFVRPINCEEIDSTFSPTIGISNQLAFVSHNFEADRGLL